MMWNYRIVKVYDEEIEEDCFEICEVYYDRNNIPWSYCEASVFGEDIKELHECLDMMALAFTKPILEKKDFVGTYYEDEAIQKP